jgi:hypothetical protein
MRTLLRSTLLLAAFAAAGCNDDPITVIDPGNEPGRPTDVRARYEWILQGWSGDRAVGRPAVIVTWSLPAGWDGEPFRVYGGRAGQSLGLVATVTSCEGGGCRYTDINVVSGTRYEYYVATVNERSGREATSEFRESVSVPAYSPPPAPLPDSAVGLDNAAYLRWRDGGAGASLWKYAVILDAVGGSTVAGSYTVGETDSRGYLDLRARNGQVYRYRISAVDTLGHFSNLSAAVNVVPRPDFRGELLYAFSDSAAASGFQFVRSDSLTPVLSGAAASAHWRLEVNAGVWQIRPLGETEVIDVGRTTALACGPASDPGCTAATRAPSSGYTRSPVPIFAEVSYVFRVRGSDGRIHHGVVRPQLLGSDQGGKRLVILDWSYQLIADDVRLNRNGS